MKASIPLVYFPFTVLFVDDDIELLKIYNDSLGSKYNVRTSGSAPDGLNIINEEALPKFHLLTDVAPGKPEVKLVEDTQEFSKVRVAFDQLLAIANDKDKYNKVGIAVVDYQMPKMNGIELCEGITNATKKILLTGEFDLSCAVTALNNKKIDCFIRKGEKDTMKNLDFFVAQLKDKYFEELTKSISSTVITDKWKFLKDANYIEFFYNLIEENKICEFYFIDNNGNFLLINDKSEKSVLVRYDDQGLNEFCDFFEGEDEIGHLIAAVRDRELIPYFGINVDPVSVDLAKWENHFYRANKHNDFYWNVVNIPSANC